MEDSASTNTRPENFVEYYAEQSQSPATLARFRAIHDAVLRTRRDRGVTTTGLQVADVGCGAGTQSIMWARGEHTVHGLDVNEGLIDLARARAAEQGASIEFHLGSAVALPWADASMDVCIVPELLEHVEDWQSVVDEAVRVLGPEGTLYLSTTNRLCPVQQEFDLPMYSWYPPALKRHYERLSVTTRPELVNHATYPAVHWFTVYQLSDYLKRFDMVSQDRFDIVDLSNKGMLPRLVVHAIRKAPPLRWLGQIATPYSVVVAHK